jgi:hypothetical protein
MRPIAAVVVAGLAGFAVGCSSSSSTNICCISIQGNNQAWSCPSDAAFQACCGANDPSSDGCLTNPTGAPQNSCVTVSYSANCSGG